MLNDIWVKESGKAAAEVNLLVHGLGADSDEYLWLLPELDKHFTNIIFDQRGHGRSIVEPKCPVGVDYTVSDMIRLMNEKGIGRCNVLGHSLGGMVALKFALLYPERLNRLIIVDSTACMKQTPVTYKAMEIGLSLAEFISDDIKAEIGTFVTTNIVIPHGSMRKDIYDYWMKKKPRMIDHSYFTNFEKYVRDIRKYDVRKEIRNIKNETLIIHGQKDKTISLSNGQYLQRHIPHSRLVVFKNAYHSPVVEDVDRFNNVVNRFFQHGLSNKTEHY